MCAAVILIGLLCATVAVVFAFEPADSICENAKPKPLTKGSTTGTRTMPSKGFKATITLTTGPTVKYTVDCASKRVTSAVLLNPADDDKTEIKNSNVNDCTLSDQGVTSAKKFEWKSESGMAHCCSLTCFSLTTATMSCEMFRFMQFTC